MQFSKYNGFQCSLGKYKLFAKAFINYLTFYYIFVNFLIQFMLLIQQMHSNLLLALCVPRRFLTFPLFSMIFKF